MTEQEYQAGIRAVSNALVERARGLLAIAGHELPLGEVKTLVRQELMRAAYVGAANAAVLLERQRRVRLKESDHAENE